MMWGYGWSWSGMLMMMLGSLFWIALIAVLIWAVVYWLNKEEHQYDDTISHGDITPALCKRRN